MKDHELAGVVSVVARNAELRSWPPGEAATVLSMLGVDLVSAKQALRRSRRLRWVQSLVPKPSRPSAAIVEPIPVPFCRAGLHPMTPENRITRPDRTSGQCRACTNARNSSPRYLAQRRARRARS